ncbi:uncharacterized protein LOC133805791 [Humulus lupulus]|uniref:uncharacterized protein LOC133805791 n=1 Tax=Humulus lupulus TaxID=3486 RepID=UPI002B402C78|nr:uncharacterized protein LOC133805791 [Humulus lupulus]
MVAKVRVSCIMLDCGSTMNVLPLKTLRDVSLHPHQLSPSSLTIQGFNQVGEKVRGSITIKVEIGELNSEALFHVIDSDTSYNMLLGRSWLHEYGVNYADAKFYKSANVTVLKGKFEEAKCPKSSTSQKSLQVKQLPPVKPCQPKEEDLKGHETQEDEENIAQINYLSFEESLAEEYEGSSSNPSEEFIDIVQPAPQELKDGGQATVDDLIEINLGTEDDLKPVFVSALLTKEELPQYKQVLHEYKDVFSWGYQDMPELDDTVKYPIWLANIVIVIKKNGQLRICVNYQDLNWVCPKDEFPLPITELLVDSTTGFDALSFMDGFSGCQPFSRLMQKNVPFIWDEACQNAFEGIKKYLLHPPVLRAPILGKPLILYITSLDHSLGALLAQNNVEGKEVALYYLSRTLVGAEQNYPPIEKVCLALIFAVIKLRHYLLSHPVTLVSKADPLRYILSKPVLSGRLAKWSMILSEFEINFVLQKAIKGQVLADFLAAHPILNNMELREDLPEEEVFTTETSSWQLFFDGGSKKQWGGAGIIFVMLSGGLIPYSFHILAICTNNVAEYEALIIDLEIALEMNTFVISIW